MGKVATGLTMSLDGFIAGVNDGTEHPLGENGMRLFDWFQAGDTEYVVPSGGMSFMISKQSAGLIDDTFSATGAIVSGRRTFDITNGWGGRHPLDVPIFVLTHDPPTDWGFEDAPFTFVTDGIEGAVEQAKEAAGDKNVAVGAASLAQQCLNAGLLDEVHVDLVPVLLGGGVRFFDNLESPPELEQIEVIEGEGVTHITYRVIR